MKREGKYRRHVLNGDMPPAIRPLPWLSASRAMCGVGGWKRATRKFASGRDFRVRLFVCFPKERLVSGSAG